jgi:hypothetical protein
MKENIVGDICGLYVREATCILAFFGHSIETDHLEGFYIRGNIRWT